VRGVVGFASSALWDPVRNRHGSLIGQPGDLVAIGGGKVGSFGVAMVAGGSTLIRAYAHSGPAEAPNVAVKFRTLSDASVRTWQYAVAVVGGAWFVGVALVLIAALNARARDDSSISATLVLLLIAIWPTWRGVGLWNEPGLTC
jgi:hypothetical protein